MQDNTHRTLIHLIVLLMIIQVSTCDTFQLHHGYQTLSIHKILVTAKSNRTMPTSSTTSNISQSDEIDPFTPDPTPTEVDGCRTDPGDPDTIRNVVELIVSRGYKAEEYDVTTEDGYILAIQRIVNPLVTDPLKKAKLKPVILQHGLMSSAADWVLNSVGDRPALGDTDTNSLGFYLANRGYDVFLANSRGNIYGQRHINLTSWDARFWDFCFDEKIDYDLPATFEFVRRLTKSKQVGYVGHSQGSAMMFGLMSKNPDFANIVQPFIALAPVAYVEHALTPLRHLDFITPYIQERNKPFTTNREIIDFMATKVCNKQVVRQNLCKNFIFLIMGFNEEELDPERIPAILCHAPSGTSLKNLAHYGQEIRSGRFARFDRGSEENMHKYGSPEAPDYELGAIRSKTIVLFTAENDWLASPKDVAHLVSSLQVKPYASINMTEMLPLWNHIDFLYGKHTGKLINPRVYEFLELFSQQR